MKIEQVRRLIKSLKEAAGDRDEYEGECRPGVDQVSIFQVDAWELIELLEEIVK